jgi:hypothetical protein
MGINKAIIWDSHLYLKQGGSTLAFAGYTTGDSYIYYAGTSPSANTTSTGLRINSGHLYPLSGSIYDLGKSGTSWDSIWVDHYNSNSDVNLKTDITDETKGLDFVKALRPVTYKWKSTGDGDGGLKAGVRNHHGFIAQEVETVLGESAATDGLWGESNIAAVEAVDAVLDEDGNILEPAIEASDAADRQVLRYVQFLGPMVKAIQELAARVEALEGG